MPVSNIHRQQLQELVKSDDWDKSSGKKLVKIARKNEYLDMLDDITDDKNDARTQTQSNPNAFAKNKGFTDNDLDGINLKLTLNNWNLELCAGSACLKYDSNSGFSTK
jgi:hypothetical protein